MSLTADGRAALQAMLSDPTLFSRVRDSDWTSAAVKLAKKQVIAAGQTTDSLNELKTRLGSDLFERTLDTLTAFQAKQLAKRIDPSVSQETIASCSMALTHIRAQMSGAPTSAKPDTPDPAQTSDDKPKNKYLGRKAFRTGR